jgi:tripartite-type tricarboxylate transporter receptor subunit TctC
LGFHFSFSGRSGAVRTDLLPGRIQMMFDNVAATLPYVLRGELRGFAVTKPRLSETITPSFSTSLS